jgi:hypothetical protein
MPLPGPSRRAAIDAEDERKRKGLEDKCGCPPGTLLSMPKTEESAKDLKIHAGVLTCSRDASVDAEDGRKREGLEDIRGCAPRTLLSMPKTEESAKDLKIYAGVLQGR